MAKNEKHNLEKRGSIWYFFAKKNGKRYHEKLSTNLREAKRMRGVLLNELKRYGCLANGHSACIVDVPVDGMLFGEASKVWMEVQCARVKKGDLKQSSLDDYRSSMNLYVLPEFGGVPMGGIMASDVEDFALHLPVSKKRSNNVLVPMRSVFKMAKKRKLVDEDIMKDVDNFTTEKTDIFPLSRAEVQLFLGKSPKHYRPFFTTLFFTGMRFGEIAVLKWKNVDLDRGIINIRETRVRGIEDRTKTKGSKREIDILPPVKLALEEQRQMKWRGKYVFRDREGALMTPDHIRNTIWTPTMKMAELEYRPPKQTRHTFATIAIDSGESLGWVQYMLGHTSLQMIFQTYHSWIKRATQNNGSAMMESWDDSSEQLSEVA
jgi:integrase